MKNDNGDSSELAKLDRALLESVERYSTLLKLMQQITAAVSAEKGQVESFAHALTQQQRHIEEEDAVLLAQLEQLTSEELVAHPVFHERLKLMGEIKAMNDLLLPKISGIMALIFQEIGELKSGRNAVSGYRTQGQGATSKRSFTA